MRRKNYVCWNCRLASRHSHTEDGHPGPSCPKCQEEMEGIGDRWRIPPRRDKKAWRKLKRYRQAYCNVRIPSRAASAEDYRIYRGLKRTKPQH